MKNRIDRSTTTDSAPDDEARVRQLVDDMYATPGGRALLEWMFELRDTTWDLLTHHLDEVRARADARTDDERREDHEQFQRKLRERYPHVTDTEWARWGL